MHAVTALQLKCSDSSIELEFLRRNAQLSNGDQVSPVRTKRIDAIAKNMLKNMLNSFSISGSLKQFA